MTGDEQPATRRGLGRQLRLPFVLFGGLFAFQSSPEIDAAKIAYFVGAIVCLVGAALTAYREWTAGNLTFLRPWFLSSGALVALVALSFVIARMSGTPLVDWARDAATYALFAAVPIFAVDGAYSLSRRVLIGILIIAGVFGGLSWAVEWLARRDIVELPIARLIFPSPQLPALLYIYAIAGVLIGPRRFQWAAVAGVVLGLFLITGTRSSLIFLAAPVVAVVVERRWRSVRPSVVPLASHAAVAAVVVLVFQGAITVGPTLVPQEGVQPRPSSAAASPGADVVGERFGSVPELFRNPASDASVRERAAQYGAAWQLFASSPLAGVGPGHPIPWIDVSGFARDEYTADTPLVMPAKFGLLGVAVFIGFAVAFVTLLRRALIDIPGSKAALAFTEYGALIVLGLPLGFLVEDKGTSLGLMLLLAITITSLREPRANGEASFR